MVVENLLALIKAASPSSRRSPTAERLCHAGNLSRTMRSFLDLGFTDPRGPDSRARLLAQGVPVRQSKAACAKERLYVSHAPRPHVAYANLKLAEYRATNPAMSLDECRSSLIREYFDRGCLDVEPTVKEVKPRPRKHKLPEPSRGEVHPAWRRVHSTEWPLDIEIFESELPHSHQGRITNQQNESLNVSMAFHLVSATALVSTSPAGSQLPVVLTQGP